MPADYQVMDDLTIIRTLDGFGENEQALMACRLDNELRSMASRFGERRGPVTKVRATHSTTKQDQPLGATCGRGL